MLALAASCAAILRHVLPAWYALPALVLAGLAIFAAGRISMDVRTPAAEASDRADPGHPSDRMPAHSRRTPARALHGRSLTEARAQGSTT